MTFEESQKVADCLWEHSKQAGAALNEFLSKHPKGVMGLTPDNVRAMPEYKQLHAAYQRSHEALRVHNALHVKTYAKEIKAFRKRRFAGTSTVAA